MYVGTYLDRSNNKLLVSERIKGQRITTDYSLILEYYLADENGYYNGLDGKKLKKVTYRNTFEQYQLKKDFEENHIQTYELNFNLTNKVLHKYYNGAKSPELHKSFFDIEVDRKGYEYLTVDQLIEKACCPINAISIYNNWQDTLYTLMLKPETLSKEQALEVCKKFENTFLFDDEKGLLEALLVLFEDSDCLIGYNSSRFDIPYIVRRLNNKLGKKSANRLNVWDIEPKEKSAKDDFGSVHIEYELYGKWNVDYLVLYKKHERGKKESYKLDSIAELELGENKVQHDESLEDMYRNRYEDFILYNRQDTMLVKRLEDKLKYIDIHNRQCHSICCSYDATLGTVAWVDQAIINEAHESNIIVPDRLEGKNKEFDGIVPPGAFVPVPVPGLAEYIMSYDMASLYPNTTIALNMSTETIIGQVRLTKTIPYLWKKIEDNDLYANKGKKIPKWGDAWLNEWGTLEFNDVLAKNDEKLIVDLEGGSSVEMTAKQIHDMIFSENSNLNISAFGTIFRTDKEGLVSRMFKRWYSERKSFKKTMGHFEDLEAGIKINENISGLLNDFTNPNKSNTPIEYDIDKLKQLVEENNIENIKQFMLENDLELSKDGRIVSKHIDYFHEQVNYWDLEQYVKKICLNSSYGSILNNGSIFFDFRFGSSITMSGRKVWQHLASKTNEVLCGKYIHYGECLTTGDTDSVYMSLNQAFKEKNPDFNYDLDNVVKFADEVGDIVNKSFPQYMIDTFHCTPEGAAREGSAREVVARRGLICGKKRYALLVIDKDGYRQDINGKPGKMKIMGIQVARSDTPKLVRGLLKDMLQSILVEGTKEKLYEILKEFGKTKWSQLEPWEKGRPKACNKLKFYTDEYNRTGKCSVGQVMASINWNKLIDANNDKISPKILDGDKVIVCSLNPNNAYNMKSIAYPIDLINLPKWFKELPFAEQDMEDSIIDTTLDTIFKAVNWKLRLSDAMRTNDDINDFITFLD
jgi:DNA polymerase elongation subunit (family B)